MENLKNKNVLVVGLGVSGLAAVKFLSKAGARVSVADLKQKSELYSQLGEIEDLNIECFFGAHDVELFEKSDLLVVSPGVPLDLPEIVKARERGVGVIGELELGMAGINRPIIAITGTNGKTTTTTLIGHLLNSCGINACVAGNIGTPLLDVANEANRSDYVVLEISSFQIETTPSLSPYIGVLLNTTPDHLDRHHTFDDYVECKLNILRQVSRDGFAIYNAADTTLAPHILNMNRNVIPFDATGRVLKKTRNLGAWFGNGELIISTVPDVHNRYSISKVKLEGIHNRENMLSALLVAELCGAKPEKLLHALESFKGLPHRLELVIEHKGVRFYDDSKGTNIGATMRALEGFAEPVVLIAGGLAKGVNFDPMKITVKKHVKRLILIGEAADEMESIFGRSTKVVRASSMDHAVYEAVHAAEPGDVVLLSPACASFDMFRDYKDRGEAFVRSVKNVIEKK